MRKIKILLSVFLFLATLFVLPKNSFAQEITDASLEATVVRIAEERTVRPAGMETTQLYQKLELFVNTGIISGRTITVESGDLAAANVPRYRVGDRLVINYNRMDDGQEIFIIADYVRRDGLLILFIVFAGVAILVGRWHGLMSLLGMAITFIVIFKFLLPQISAGNDPVTTSILACIFMAPVTFYLSHGLNKKTTIAIVSTILTLIITGIMANYFLTLTHLSGFASEEAGFLQSLYPGTINIRGLLLAGLIIGGLGIFDDITVSQAAIVAELKNSLPKANFKELYLKAMKIGHDHIASLINTLVLIYAGAAMPLLILFVKTPRPFSEIVNYESISEEIVRTLIASTGLILAVPITTFLAAYIYKKSK